MSAVTTSKSELIDKETVFGIVPLLKKNRVYTLLDVALVSGSLAIATWCYVQGGSLASVMSMPQTLASLVGTYMGTMALVLLIGVLSTKYGVDHWLVTRCVLGYWSVAVFLIINMIAGQAWNAINAGIYGSAITSLLSSAGVEGATNPWALKLIALTCPLIGLAIAWSGPRSVKISSWILGASLLLVGLIMVIMMAVSGELGTAWKSGPLSGAPADWSSYMLGTEWNVAFVFSWFTGLGVLTRLGKTERAGGWGIYLGFGVCVALYIFVGAAVAFVATAKGAPPVMDPTVYLLEVGGPTLGALTLVIVGFANISTAAVTTYVVVMATKVVFPSWHYSWLAIFYTGVTIGYVLWGEIMTYYGTLLAFVGVMFAPLVSLLVVDYWILRRRRIHLASIFKYKGSAYAYTGGVNIAGIVAFAAGAAVYLTVYDPVHYTPRFPVVMDVIPPTLLAALASVAVYLLLAAVPPVRRYILRDRGFEDLC